MDVEIDRKLNKMDDKESESKVNLWIATIKP